MALATVFTQANNHSDSYSVDEIFYRLDRRWLDSLYCLWLYQCDGLTYMHGDRLSRGVLTDGVAPSSRLTSFNVTKVSDLLDESTKW